MKTKDDIDLNTLSITLTKPGKLICDNSMQNVKIYLVLVVLLIQGWLGCEVVCRGLSSRPDVTQ